MSTDSIDRIEGDILNDHAMAAKSAFVAAPDDEEVLREIRKYKTTEIQDFHDQGNYREFMESSFKPLGIYREEFLPQLDSSCYKVTCDDQMVAIFRLTEVMPGSVFHQIIPGSSGRRIIEVNNVAVEKDYRGELLLGIILRNCALLSHLKGCDVVAGVVRYDVLPYFVDFGTIPVPHEPFHLLGDPTIDDYITYFMTGSRDHVEYAVARGYHYFHRKIVMNNIKADVKRRRRETR
jgi:hypothetical protein